MHAPRLGPPPLTMVAGRRGAEATTTRLPVLGGGFDVPSLSPLPWTLVAGRRGTEATTTRFLMLGGGTKTPRRGGGTTFGVFVLNSHRS